MCNGSRPGTCSIANVLREPHAIGRESRAKECKNRKEIVNTGSRYPAWVQFKLVTHGGSLTDCSGQVSVHIKAFENRPEIVTKNSPGLFKIGLAGLPTMQPQNKVTGSVTRGRGQLATAMADSGHVSP